MFSLVVPILGHLRSATTHNDPGPDPSYSTTPPHPILFPPPVSITVSSDLPAIIHLFSRVLTTSTKCDYADSERHFLSAIQQCFKFGPCGLVLFRLSYLESFRSAVIELGLSCIWDWLVGLGAAQNKWLRTCSPGGSNFRRLNATMQKSVPYSRRTTQLSS
jgi:hypothetical protein